MSEESVKEFASTLADLCLNSQPLINMLTNLAGECEAYAGKIVKVLEGHLTKIEAYRKLPAIIVMDSIIKNIRGLYPVLFEENIVATYMNVYREVDLQTRVHMLQLRFSWSGIFPPEKLQAIDEQMKNIVKDLTMKSSYQDHSDYRISYDLLIHQPYQHEPSKYRLSSKRKLELSTQHIIEEDMKSSEPPRKKTRRRH